MRDSGNIHGANDIEGRSLTSLLWPPDLPLESRAGPRLSPEAGLDLDIAPLVGALSAGGHESFVAGLLMGLCTDEEVIAYRADVVDNLLDAPGIREGLETLLPPLSTLVRERQRPLFRRQWAPGDIAQRLAELEMYVEVAIQLGETLETNAVRAPALGNLRASVRVLLETPQFEVLRAELPDLRAQVEGMQSVTIGVNLSPGLQPESATILSIDSTPVEGRGGLLGRLLGREAGERGITRLRGPSASGGFPFFPPMVGDRQTRENELVEDLRRLLEEVMAPVGKAIERHVWVRTRDFAVLERELSFLLNAVALIEQLRNAGLPMCRPQLAPIDAGLTCLDESYDISLALRMEQEGDGRASIVTNPVTFDGTQGRVWILTGPNRGGKTTFTRAVGLAHLLLGAGLHVPARSARMSPVDDIYTHFPARETTEPGEGRLDDEAERLAGIFREATPHSLILLNEVLAGTSTVEGLALAHDAVRGLRLLGARAIYVTHLHELATRVEQINRTTEGDAPVGSLVAGVDEAPGNGDGPHARTFRIRPGAPLGISYASEIAEQHGISYHQLARLLRSRGIIPSADS